MCQGPIHEHADLVRLRIGQDLGLDIAMEEAVRRLKRFHRQCPAELVHLLRVEVGDADMAYLACSDQLGQGTSRLREGRPGIRPMHLEQIDVIGGECTQALVDAFADRRCTRVTLDARTPQRSQTALGCDDDAVARVPVDRLRQQQL